MIKQTSNSKVREIEKAINALSKKDRLTLLEKMEKDLYPARFRSIVRLIRSKAKTSSAKKIRDISEEIRQKLYDEESKASHS